MAVLINSDMICSTYNSLHYKLDADIDLEGEKLFVIGDGSYTSSVFLGTFDGAGHTISNFRLEDEAINQSNFTTVYLPYVGLFGQASATAVAPCEIKNLTLKDYTVNLHPARVADSPDNPIFAAGSVVGYAMGAEITNCHVEGAKIVSAGSYQKTQFIGGIVGVLQSVDVAMSSGQVVYDTYLNGCSANVDLEGTGTPFTAGGLVGYLLSVDENAIAYVINCSSAGSVRGARQTGGIVGTLGRYTSVTACYSNAEVVARNDIPGANVQYAHAYAGGIAGYADEDTVIAYCCSAGEYYSAHSSTPANGALTFEHTDYILGGKEPAGVTAANSCATVTHKNAKYVNNDTFTQLGWSASEWNLTGAMPVPVVVESDKDVKLKVYSGSDSVDQFAGERLPVAGWYAQNLMDKYPENPAGNGRSWGYYFDEQLTQRVPLGFVPLGDETLYVGFADYSEVVGKYYISPLKNSRNGYVELTADGRAIVRNG
ncbi:MAG: hypothetical protein K2O54_08155, partial [Prevotella sp.]|nr:hypothetical protein [Prevotella sp.]